MSHGSMCSTRRLFAILCLCLGLSVAVSVPAVAWGATPESKTPPGDIPAAVNGTLGFGDLIPLETGAWRSLGGGGVGGLGSSEEELAARASSRPAEVIVQFANGADTGPAGRAAGRAGARLKEMRPARSRAGVSFAVYSSESLSAEELAKTFEGVSGVVAVATNDARYLAGVPSDPAFGHQWGLENTGQLGGTVDADVDASAAWDVDTGSADVVVAVIDTGVDYANPDLAANMWHNPGEIAGDGIDNDGNGYVDDVFGIDTRSDDSDPDDTYGHGTAVAGTIAAVGNNGLGTAGVAWTTKIMALRAGDQTLDTADIDEAIQYAIDMKLDYGVNVVAINASFGGPDYNPVEKNLIDAAGAAGIVFCAAADNQGQNIEIPRYTRYPAAYTCSNIISVGASDPSDERAYFSNYGATSVDLFAPGETILATAMRDGYYYPGPADFFFDDVEYSGAELPYGGWTPGGSWAIITSSFPGLMHSWTDSVGLLSNNADVSLTSATMDLSRLKGKSPHLAFACTYSFEDGYDFVWVEMSGDGGSSWTVLGLTGDSGGWGLANIQIPDQVLTSSFKMRFRSVTDSSVQSEGFTVDEIGIEWPGCTTVDGTSFAAPYVAGSVALLASAAPWKTMGERIAGLLAAVDAKAALSGLCVTGGRLNVQTAIKDYVSERAQQSDTRLTFIGAWQGVSDGASSGGSHYYADKAGAAVNVSFTGTSLSVVARTAPWYGKADVIVDGVAAGQVDFFSRSVDYQRVVYNTGVLSDGAHTLTLRWSGDKNTSSTGTGMAVDGVRAWTTVTQSPPLSPYEQDRPEFNYTGAWATSGTDAQASGGTFKSTEAPGSSVTVKFTGTSAQWRARTTPWYGMAKVVLDAGTPDELETTVDLWSSSVKYRQVVYSTGLLKDGVHTLSVYWTGQHNPSASGTAISTDAFEFLGTPSAADPAPAIEWRYQETDPKLTYLGYWSDSGDTGWQASGNSFKSAAQPGAAAVIKFTGTAVTPVLRTTPWYGEAKLTLDPGTAGEHVQTVDLYSASVGWKVTSLHAKTGLADTEHVLVIECTGQKNGASSGYAVGVDAFAITGYLEQAQAATKIDDKLTDAAGAAYFTYSPGIDAGASTTAWSRWDASGYWAAYQDTYAYTDQLGYKTTFTFDGTFASWVAATSNTKGKALVTLDPGPGQTQTTIDLYSPTTLWKQPVYSTGLLTSGTHTIEIECLYQKNPAAWWYTIDVDRFDVLASAP